MTLLLTICPSATGVQTLPFKYCSTPDAGNTSMRTPVLLLIAVSTSVTLKSVHANT